MTERDKADSARADAGLAEPVGEQPITDLAKQMGPDLAGHAVHTGANRTAEEVRPKPASPGAAIAPETAGWTGAYAAAGITHDVHVANEDLDVEGQRRYNAGDRVTAEDIERHGWQGKVRRIDEAPKQ